MTTQAKVLYDFNNLTIEYERLEELDFQAKYQKINASALKDLIRSAVPLKRAGKRRA
ncbi:MAG: hypothetical protein P8X63_05315 [Desulfuromonadaceae bacterium]